MCGKMFNKCVSLIALHFRVYITDIKIRSNLYKFARTVTDKVRLLSAYWNESENFYSTMRN